MAAQNTLERASNTGITATRSPSWVDLALDLLAQGNCSPEQTQRLAKILANQENRLAHEVSATTPTDGNLLSRSGQVDGRRDYLNKIHSADSLETLVESWRSTNPGTIVGVTSGVYDIIHQGHVYFLDEAATRCDKLIVIIASDRTVREQKGEGKPYQPEQSRAKLIAALASVDAVFSL